VPRSWIRRHAIDGPQSPRTERHEIIAFSVLSWQKVFFDGRDDLPTVM